MRNYALIVLGLNSVLRISDILSLIWGDLFDLEENQFKVHVYVKENKTSKVKKFLLNRNAVDALSRLKKKLGYINTKEYIFKSRKG